MVFKKSLAALVFALPLILGMNLIFSKNVDSLTMISLAALPNKRNAACDFLEPIKQDLLENLFDNECGDTVSLLSPYYEHLSKGSKGSWCSASLFPWCHRNFSNLRVIIFKLVLSHRSNWFLGGKKLIRGGGADGSIIIFNATEFLDPGNVGIDDVLGEISPFFFKHAAAITPGDLCVSSETTFRFSTWLMSCVQYSIRWCPQSYRLSRRA